MTAKIQIPKVIAHRGAKAYAPENTLAAIHAAADMGIEWVELDVKLTKDQKAIIFHDEDLLRCTGAQGLVAQTDLRAIRELDAGSWFGDSFIGEKIPTLEEALETIIARGLGVNLEIKPCPGRERETAEVALDIATRIWPDDGPAPLVSSFQHVSLEAAMDMMPDWPRGVLFEAQPPGNWPDFVQYLDAHTINIDGNNSTDAQIETYVETRKTVLAYTVNDPMRAKQLLRLGVDGVFADNPDVILEAVETRH